MTDTTRKTLKTNASKVLEKSKRAGRVEQDALIITLRRHRKSLWKKGRQHMHNDRSQSTNYDHNHL